MLTVLSKSLHIYMHVPCNFFWIYALCFHYQRCLLQFNKCEGAFMVCRDWYVRTGWFVTKNIKYYLPGFFLNFSEAVV